MKMGKRTVSAISGAVERLALVTSRQVKTEARRRLKPTGNPEIDFENNVWTVVYSLTPKAITVGRDPEVHLEGQTFRPDVVASFDNSLGLVVECKRTKYDAFVANWLSQFRDLKRELERVLQASDFSQIVYVLAVEDKSALKDHTRNEANQLRVKLVDQREIDYFRNLQKACGIGVAHLFWARIAPRVVRQAEEKLPAMRVKRGRGREVYVFSVNAHDLLSRSFISHRELHSPEEGEVGFQRMLQRKKLSEIAKYIKKFKVFPTPLVVAFASPGAEVFEPLPMKQRAADSMKERIEFGHIKLPASVNSLQIIDGQHRLYGYSQLPRSDEHIVHVVAYRTTKDQSPATMFVDINSKQTRVASSLLWELYPDIHGADDPEHYKAVISNAMERVARKRLPGQVRHITSGTKGAMSFHTLCAELKRTRLLDKRGGILQTEQELDLLVDTFFTVLGHLGASYPAVNTSFVFSNNGITPLIRTIGRIVRYEIGHDRADNLRRRSALVETFRSFFEPVYKHLAALGEDGLRTLRRQRIGNAGSNTTEDEITECIRSGYKADFPYRPKKIPPDWVGATDELSRQILEVNRLAAESGKIKSWVFKEFDHEKFRKATAKPVDNSDTFGTILKILYQELIEGSGKDGSDNRLTQLLGILRIYDLQGMGQLNILRTYWEHKPEQVDAKKRQAAVQALADLSNRLDIVGPSELTPADYQNIAIALVRKLSEQVLKRALEALHAT